MSHRNLITERVSHTHKQMIFCQTNLNSELATGTAKLEVLTRFNSFLTSGHNAAMLREAKHLKEDLENSKISVDDTHMEFIMNVDPGLGEAFQARTLLNDFHNKINRAVAAIWVHVAEEPVDLPTLLA